MKLKVRESYYMFAKYIFNYDNDIIIIKNFNLDFAIDCNNIIGFTSYNIIYEFIDTYNYVFIFKNIKDSQEKNKIPRIEFEIPELDAIKFDNYTVIDCIDKYLIIDKTAYNYIYIVEDINKDLSDKFKKIK